jgi:hypothetical protein
MIDWQGSDNRDSRRLSPLATTVSFVGIELDGIISDFSAVAGQLRLPGWPAKLDLECMAAPHKPKALRPGHGAVYVFALADGVTSEAGLGRVLKVGRGWARSLSPAGVADETIQYLVILLE